MYKCVSVCVTVPFEERRASSRKSSTCLTMYLCNYYVIHCVSSSAPCVRTLCMWMSITYSIGVCLALSPERKARVLNKVAQKRNGKNNCDVIAFPFSILVTCPRHSSSPSHMTPWLSVLCTILSCVLGLWNELYNPPNRCKQDECVRAASGVIVGSRGAHNIYDTIASELGGDASV